MNPVLPLPAPATPMRLPPLSMKVPATLLASGPTPPFETKFLAIMVFWTLMAEPAVPAQKMPPPLLAKLLLIVSLRRKRSPVKVAGASMPPPLAPALFRAVFWVIVLLIISEAFCPFARCLEFDAASAASAVPVSGSRIVGEGGCSHS